MRVAIYTRLSPNPRKDDTINQERGLLEYVSHQEGWVIVEHYKDMHVSGGKRGKDRPQFAKMMEDARKRKFDLILFWSLDRLSREGVFETISYLNQITSYGVNYKSYTEQYLDSCGMFKDAIIAIMAVIAKQERIRLSERTIAGLETARAKGKTLGRPKVTVSMEGMRQVKMEEGLSLRETAIRFNISPATVYRLLKNG